MDEGFVGRPSRGEKSLPRVDPARFRSSPRRRGSGRHSRRRSARPKGRAAMRVMVIVKATRNSEAGILPGDPRAPAGYDKLFEQMGKFNEELVNAGVMLAGEGLHPSSKGK